MPMFDANFGKIVDVMIVREAVLTPDTGESGEAAGKPVYSLKAVFPQSHPDLPMVQQMAQKALIESEFRGQMPAGGHTPHTQLGADKYEGKFNGHYEMKFKTYHFPQVFDENGAPIDPMRLGQILYTGQRVSILFNCKTYNNKSKGVNAYMAAFQILESRQAPRQQFNNGGVNAAAAFGQPQPQQGFGQPQPQQGFGQPQPQQGFGQPQPQQGFGYQQ
jgi:hypothetical protein